MWLDYESSYDTALQDASFLAWREAGARRKAFNIVRVCREIVVESIIEIGCGTGAVLQMLHGMRFAKEYACVDISFSAVQFTRESCKSFCQRAFVSSAHALPIRDRSFSVAILSHVIEHLDNPIPALSEASRIARYVVVEVPVEKVLSNVIRTRLFGHPYASIAEAGHVQFWSSSSIASFLENKCQLEILSRQRDLLNRNTEFFGKKGFTLAKPVLKETLKTALPAGLYSRLLTTHVAFLCRRAESNKKNPNTEPDTRPKAEMS